MLRHGKRLVALRLAIPARDAGEAMGDILNLDIERSRNQACGPTTCVARRAVRREIRRLVDCWSRLGSWRVNCH